MEDFYSLENVNLRKLLRLFYVVYRRPRDIGLGEEIHHKEFKSRTIAIAFAKEVKGDVHAPSGATSWTHRYQK